MVFSSASLRDFLAKRHPDFPIRSCEILGEGLENLALEINGRIIVRFAKDPANAQPAQNEARLLQRLAGQFSAPTPAPIAELSGLNYFAYTKIQGQPLILLLDQLKAEALAAICERLGVFLAELHALPAEAFREAVPGDVPDFAAILHEAGTTFNTLKEAVPQGMHAEVRAFLGGPLPSAPPRLALIHNDLGIEHVVVDGPAASRLGIIDWSDAAIGDPAMDFARLYRDLGAANLGTIMGRYSSLGEPITDFWARTEFYARAGVFEELAYGLTPGHENYLTRAQTAMRRLFTAQ